MTVKKSASTEFKAVEVVQEQDYDFQSFDLGILRNNAQLDISGSSLTIWTLDGSCSMRFDVVTKPLIPFTSFVWPSMIVFDRAFTNIYLTNAIQAGKTLTVHFGKK